MAEKPRGDDDDDRGNVRRLIDHLAPLDRARVYARRAFPVFATEPRAIAIIAETAAGLEEMNFDRLGEIEAVDAATLEELLALRSARAMRDFLRGDVAGGNAQWEAIIAEHPDAAAEAHRWRGMIRMFRGEPDAALLDLDRACELLPADADVYRRRGECLAELNQLDAGIANLRRAVALDPSSAPTAFSLGLLLHLADQTPEAIRAYSAAIAVAPRLVDALVGRAKCFQELGRSAEARLDLDRAIAINPDDASSFLWRARCKLPDDCAGAIADCVRATELDPDLGAAFEQLAKARLQIGDYAGALSAGERAVALEPESAVARFARGLAHQANGDLDGARADYEAARALDRTEPLYVAACAKVHAKLDDDAAIRRDILDFFAFEPPEEVLVQFAKLLEDEEAVLRALLQLRAPGGELAEGLLPAFERAVELEAEERWAEAIVEYDACIAHEPTCSAYWFRRGAAKWQAKGGDDARGALADYDRAIELDGDLVNAEMLRWRIAARDALGDSAGAMEDADRAIALEPDHGEAYFQRSELRKALGDEGGARADLGRGAELGWEEAVEALAASSDSNG